MYPLFKQNSERNETAVDAVLKSGFPRTQFADFFTKQQYNITITVNYGDGISGKNLSIIGYRNPRSLFQFYLTYDIPRDGHSRLYMSMITNFLHTFLRLAS